MDLLSSAYGNASDDEEDERVREPSTKRFRLDRTSGLIKPLRTPPGRWVSGPQRETSFISGRYVSKRERAASAAAAVPDSTDSSCPSTATVSTVGSTLDSDLQINILCASKHQRKGPIQPSNLPERLTVALSSHTKAVNAIYWSPTHGHLLASAGMDQTICVWNAWNTSQQKARLFSSHKAAVKDVKWSSEGLYLLSCGYDCSSRLIDVEKGIEMQVFKENQVINTVKFQPGNSNIFLSGGSKGSLRLWDIRLGKTVREYVRDLGPILDVEFSVDAKHLVSSSDVSRTNLSENAIIVWDVHRQVPLSNQVYVEAYTCPCIRFHPFESSFVAQSNGNYIAIFSSRSPFRLDQYKRYEQHGVSGFPIKCNFSLDGTKIASGSSDGCIYFYNYKTSELIKKIKVYEQACIDVAFHPILPNVIASCSWNGDVSVFE